MRRRPSRLFRQELRRKRSSAGVTLAEALVGLIVLQVGVLGILYSTFSVAKQGFVKDQRIDANSLANYLLAEVMAKEYSDPYDSDTTGRGINVYWDDRGYDRTADDVFDTDYMNLAGIAPDSFSNNDGIRIEASIGESDGLQVRREWNDVDDYDGFVWGPPFADEWGVPLRNAHDNIQARVIVESVQLTALDVPVAWNSSTGAKRVTIAVLLRGDTVFVEKGVKLEKFAQK